MKLTTDLKRKVKYYIENNPNASNAVIATIFNVETSEVSKLKTNVKTKGIKLIEISKQEAIIKYNNAKGVNKTIARDLLVKAIMVTEGKILGLACPTCDFELQVIKEVSDKFKFETAECGEVEYFSMLDTIVKHRINMSAHKGYFADLINKASANEYVFVNADFCSQFGTNHIDLGSIIEKDIVKVGGAIGFTVNKRIACGESRLIFDLMERLNPKTDINEMSRVEHSVRTFINRVGGMKYAIETVLNYKDKSAMLLVIIRRIA